MSDAERRKDESPELRAMRKVLNEAQKMALSELERFGWQLKFVRRPLFQPELPILYYPDTNTYAVLDADGELIESPPDLVIR